LSTRISSVGNLQLFRKVQLRALQTFLTHDAAEAHVTIQLC